MEVTVNAGYSLDWDAGATAQIELFSPPTSGGGYQLKYTPAFRSTLRPPVQKVPLGARQLDPIIERLEDFARHFGGVSRGAAPAATTEEEDEALTGFRRSMSMLYRAVLPQRVQVELRPPGLFLEIGIDEDLLGYPLELMHDGKEFICEKHYVGRYVNVSSPVIPSAGSEPWGSGSNLGELSVLLIAVPRPRPREDGTTYDPLPEVDAEMKAIATILTDLPGVKPKLLSGRQATYDRVFDALQEGPHIVHFSGHAHYRPDEPGDSGLVLYDGDMPAGPLHGFVGEHAPILCFMNACETSRQAIGWKEGYDVYSLARALLETGAYLVGSRWRVSDKAASTFAATFYRALLAEGKSLGPSVKEARDACDKATGQTDFGWASYVLYGDPRVAFRKAAGAAG